MLFLHSKSACLPGGVGSAEGCAVTLDSEPGLLHLLQEGLGKGTGMFVDTWVQLA